MMHRKPSFAEYTDWLRDNHSVSVDQRMRNHYLIATDAMKRQLCDCSFWQRVTAELPNFDSLYQERTAYDLIVDSNPDVLTKPFDSFLIKTYRRNVNANSNWPEPPDGGWLLPDNWLSRVNDLVRTTIVVKYLDGVGYLIEKFSELSEQYSFGIRCDLEARVEGYYAAHLYYKHCAEIPRRDFDTEFVQITMEIQISTSVKEIIKKLLHIHYENRRLNNTDNGSLWQWDYKGDEFIASYLGHIIHYVEGMIVTLRDRQGSAR